jgi:hypothetical protein
MKEPRSVLEKIKGVESPLKLISTFAGITEVGGMIVLPFLSPLNQAPYMWFLICLPTVLVLLFFLTLNFNHRVLYAPSDYRTDSSFLAAMQISNNRLTPGPTPGDVKGIKFDDISEGLMGGRND